ncbi:hypothetical protein [Acinetobacter sp. ANC 3813]|uniref:hypothetical protein n=1 Tax=Acinetobacter sp. ANC 3813 TaxID=1977873 RepID=UPI000A339A9C|nr:hypothetical protein [Acinetobacter sp. ANC 3813]OTG88899.1 hypothetical protein B9T34_14150 [Acinetobacter sp. ANC 3813]
MNDFFLANGRSISVLIGESEIAVQQFKMYNLDEWFPAAITLKTFLEKKDYSDEILTELFTSHGPQVLHLMQIATSLPQADLIQGAATDEQGFKLLLKTILEVNTAYFKEPKPRQRAKSGEQQSSWFNAFQFLVAQGHQHSEIMQMSYGCFINYLKAAQKVYLDDNKLHANVIRAAHHSDKKGFEKFQSELTKH